MTKYKQTTSLAATAILLLLLLQGVAAGADQAWRQSFDETCAKTDQAMTLSIPELNALLERCAELQKVIETQEESVRKVYLKRLALCRNLYAYVLDYKKSAQTTSK